DGDYIVCGNNNGAVSFSSYSGSHCVLENIMDRVWSIRKTGTPGTFTIRFDLTGVTGFTPDELMLIVDRDNDGFDDETAIQGTYNAPYFEVADLDIPTTARLTLATGKNEWYAVVSGNSTGAIWASSPEG